MYLTIATWWQAHQGLYLVLHKEDIWHYIIAAFWSAEMSFSYDMYYLKLLPIFLVQVEIRDFFVDICHCILWQSFFFLPPKVVFLVSLPLMYLNFYISVKKNHVRFHFLRLQLRKLITREINGFSCCLILNGKTGIRFRFWCPLWWSLLYLSNLS